jgi:N-acetylglucosaminyldiphosphoundecaprenol N-acetyl-beta-D-mannosaminyltransferase
MMQQTTEKILGYPVTTWDKVTCIEQILTWIDSEEKAKYLVCANPHSIHEAESDPIFRETIKNANLVVPDGIGIVIGSKILGGNIKRRVTGSDVFARVNEALNKRGGHNVFFLGSTRENLEKIKKRVTREYPNIKVLGTYSPPFKLEFSDADNGLMVEAVNRVKPDVLWVGMTAPKQEKWIYQNKDHLDVKFIGAVGAVFDFFSGTVKRSSPFWQKIGCEWLPRFLKEPWRLWHRNLKSAPVFLGWVIRERCFHEQRRPDGPFTL